MAHTIIYTHLHWLSYLLVLGAVVVLAVVEVLGLAVVGLWAGAEEVKN